LQAAVAGVPGKSPTQQTGQVIGSIVLTSNASGLFVEMASWAERSTTETTSLVVASGDSLFEYAITPDRSRGKIRNRWATSRAPQSLISQFSRAADSSGRKMGSRAEFATRLDSLPWVLLRSESAATVFASVNGTLTTEVSTSAAIVFMIAIIIIARGQTTREKKLVEVAESEVRYRLLADNATDIVTRHAPDGSIAYVSPAVQVTLGYRPRQLEGRHLSELSHEADQVSMDQILDQLRAVDGGVRVEHRLRHADGRYVWLETSGRAVRDRTWGNVVELVTVSRDIEDRKRAEEDLRASEEEYRVLFDANPLPMWAFEAGTSRFVAVNDACVAHYGFSREEFLQMNVLDIIPPEDVDVARNRLECIRNADQRLYRSRHMKKDGSVMDVDLTVNEVKLGGRVDWLVLVKDITEALRTATALRESNEFVSTLFDSSPVAIIALDLDLKVVNWNGAAAQLFGWTADEVIGRPYPLASDAMSRELARNREIAIRDGKFTNVHTQRRRKDGTTVEVSLSVGAVRNAESQPTGFVVIAADLTEHSKLETQLRHSQKMDAVGQLAGGVAHDFNNLLTVVTGYAGILLSDLPKSNPMRADVEEIMGAADRAAVLTRQLLATSRQQVLEPRVLDLNEIVGRMDQMLRRVLPANITVNTSLDPAIGSVNADPGQLDQVLMNLIVNARDAMPEGGTLTIETMDFALDPTDRDVPVEGRARDYVMLTVSDTGCGMPQAVQARIFEPFYTTKERGKGTGLGLSTAHGIITQSGGVLSVYSELNVGTTFKVLLPRVADEVGTDAGVMPASTNMGGSELILLVEDNPPVRITATRILERAGYKVLTATNGKEALAIYETRRGQVDLIITDTIMPEMSGYDLVQRIRERNEDVAVLMMSGYTEQSSRSQSFLDAGTTFLQKPFTPESLAVKVRRALTASPAGVPS
jgi:PAS domain S-box-containing protein